jgi:hypothetical protein
VSEPVEMVGHFRAGRVYPCRFRYGGRVYRVTSVSSCWESREGAYLSYHFVVRTTDDDVFEVRFDGREMRWVLDYEYGNHD